MLYPIDINDITTYKFLRFDRRSKCSWCKFTDFVVPQIPRIGTKSRD